MNPLFKVNSINEILEPHFLDFISLENTGVDLLHCNKSLFSFWINLIIYELSRYRGTHKQFLNLLKSLKISQLNIKKPITILKESKLGLGVCEISVSSGIENFIRFEDDESLKNIKLFLDMNFKEQIDYLRNNEISNKINENDEKSIDNKESEKENDDIENDYENENDDEYINDDSVLDSDHIIEEEDIQDEINNQRIESLRKKAYKEKNDLSLSGPKIKQMIKKLPEIFQFLKLHLDENVYKAIVASGNLLIEIFKNLNEYKDDKSYFTFDMIEKYQKDITLFIQILSPNIAERKKAPHYLSIMKSIIPLLLKKFKSIYMFNLEDLENLNKEMNHSWNYHTSKLGGRFKLHKMNALNTEQDILTTIDIENLIVASNRYFWKYKNQ